MILAFLADGRDSHTARWLAFFVARGHEVHLLTTYPCRGEAYPGVRIHPVYIRIRARDAGQVKNVEARTSAPSMLGRIFALLRRIGVDRVVRSFWERTLPLEVPSVARRSREILARIRPDILHALRIPIEGYAAAATGFRPLVISSWGCDFTYWRLLSARHARLTRKTVSAADVFLADCERDRRLGLELGFPDPSRALTCPGAGGVPAGFPQLGEPAHEVRARLGIPQDAPVVLYNRGIGGPWYRFAEFAEAVPRILECSPEAFVLVLGGADHPLARRLLGGADPRLKLLPFVEPATVSAVLRASTVMVSPTTHDGTPNSLLEAMACGCVPVVSDLESIREWVTDGVNGSLFSPRSAACIARAVVETLENDELLERARRMNFDVVRRRADYKDNLLRVEEIYARLSSRSAAAEHPDRDLPSRAS